MSMYMNERQCARADFDELQERFVLEELCESEVSGSRCRRGESSERGERERCERGERCERRERCERCGRCGCNMGSGCWIRQDFRPAGPVVDGFQPIEQPMCNRCGCGCGCNGGCRLYCRRQRRLRLRLQLQRQRLWLHRRRQRGLRLCVQPPLTLAVLLSFRQRYRQRITREADASSSPYPRTRACRGWPPSAQL